VLIGDRQAHAVQPAPLQGGLPVVMETSCVNPEAQILFWGRGGGEGRQPETEAPHLAALLDPCGPRAANSDLWVV
jgi:hypothetical protein